MDFSVGRNSTEGSAAGSGNWSWARVCGAGASSRGHADKCGSCEAELELPQVCLGAPAHRIHGFTIDHHLLETLCPSSRSVFVASVRVPKRRSQLQKAWFPSYRDAYTSFFVLLARATTSC